MMQKCDKVGPEPSYKWSEKGPLEMAENKWVHNGGYNPYNWSSNPLQVEL